MKLPIAAWLIVDALATHRLTRLVTTDTITHRLRMWAGGMKIGQEATRRGVYFFVTCPWCVSVWAAAGVVAATKCLPSAWVYVALALAFSTVAGLLALVGD